MYTITICPCFSEPHLPPPYQGLGLALAFAAGLASIPVRTGGWRGLKSRLFWQELEGAVSSSNPPGLSLTSPTPGLPSLGHIPCLLIFFLSHGSLESVFACSDSLLHSLAPRLWGSEPTRIASIFPRLPYSQEAYFPAPPHCTQWTHCPGYLPGSQVGALPPVAFSISKGAEEGPRSTQRPGAQGSWDWKNNLAPG